MKGERRGALLVVAVLVVSAVLGGIYGPSVRATSSDVNSLQDSVKSFTRVLSVIEKNYATPVDTDHALYSGRELADLLKKAGFERVKLFGSLQGTPYDLNARRLVAVAMKPEREAP